MFLSVYLFFFFNDTATTEIYTLSLHDALPISRLRDEHARFARRGDVDVADVDRAAHERHQLRQALEHLGRPRRLPVGDRKSTRLNSSHSQISYAVFCLKKKK